MSRASKIFIFWLLMVAVGAAIFLWFDVVAF
jgi:hypothetical protein